MQTGPHSVSSGARRRLTLSRGVIRHGMMCDDGRKHGYCSGAAKWSACDLSCLDTTAGQRAADAVLEAPDWRTQAEHRSLQCGKLFTRGFQWATRGSAVCCPCKRQHHAVQSARAPCSLLEENGALLSVHNNARNPYQVRNMTTYITINNIDTIRPCARAAWYMERWNIYREYDMDRIILEPLARLSMDRAMDRV